MTVFLDRVVQVEYGQFYVESGDSDEVGPELAFRGQRNGLCGAALPGALFLVTGLRDGPVHLVAESHDAEPPLDDRWEEAVEVSFRPGSGAVWVKQWDGIRYGLGLPRGEYRVRYCGQGMQHGWELETLDEGEPVEHYRLDFWPAPPGADRIVRQSSVVAAMWHDEHGAATPVADPPVKSEDRLQTVRIYLGDIKALDQNLMYALARADEATHRQVARWSALVALSRAGLRELPALAPAIAALEAGDPVPAPFDDEMTAMQVHAELPHGTVARIGVLDLDSDDDPEQEWNAVLAVVATARTDSLEAALDAVVLTAIVHGEDGYRGFLADLWQAFPALAR